MPSTSSESSTVPPSLLISLISRRSRLGSSREWTYGWSCQWQVVGRRLTRIAGGAGPGAPSGVGGGVSRGGVGGLSVRLAARLHNLEDGVNGHGGQQRGVLRHNLAAQGPGGWEGLDTRTFEPMSVSRSMAWAGVRGGGGACDRGPSVRGGGLDQGVLVTEVHIHSDALQDLERNRAEY